MKIYPCLLEIAQKSLFFKHINPFKEISIRGYFSDSKSLFSCSMQANLLSIF